jgi:hypothetical protein
VASGVQQAEREERLSLWLSFLFPSSPCVGAWFQMLPPQCLTSPGLLCWKRVLQPDLPLHGKWVPAGQTPESGKGWGHGQK